MDIGKLSNSGELTVDSDDVNSTELETAPAQVLAEVKEPSRPISEITAEIIRDMDNLCDWLHKVQKLHLEITRLLQQRMEAEIAARWAKMHEQDDAVMQPGC